MHVYGFVLCVPCDVIGHVSMHLYELCVYKSNVTARAHCVGVLCAES